MPKYNERRRPPISYFRSNLVRSRSDPRLNKGNGDFRMLSGSQTVRALPQFRSSGNLLDACNEGVTTGSPHQDISMSVSSFGSGII